MSDNAAGGCGGAAVDRIHVDQKQGETAADRSRCDAFVDQLQRAEEETADENCRGGAAVDRIHVLRGASAPSGLDILANIGNFFVKLTYVDSTVVKAVRNVEIKIVNAANKYLY